MLYIKKLENRIKLAQAKAFFHREIMNLYLRTNFREYYRIKGQKFTYEDPYGEENWNV